VRIRRLKIVNGCDGDSNEEAATLAVESTRLNAEWEKFIQTQDAKKKGSAWGGTRPAAGTVTIKNLKDIVTQAGKEWETKDRFAGGKAQKYFHKFCGTLNAHSNLLDMLPNQSEYCSIFCGSIKALVQASVNHRKIAEELAKALVDISEEVEICVSEAKIFPTEDMKKAISELYAHVFQFLRKAMQWYQSKSHHKLLNSMNSDFRTTFQDQLKDIQKLSARVSRRANIGTMAELRDFRISSEAQSQQIWEEKEDWRRKAETYEMKYEFLKSITGKAAVGKGMANLLSMQAHEFLELITVFETGVAPGSPSPSTLFEIS
jgi:hypothetical protein